jgi:hypothetical protein
VLATPIVTKFQGCRSTHCDPTGRRYGQARERYGAQHCRAARSRRRHDVSPISRASSPCVLGSRQDNSTRAPDKIPCAAQRIQISIAYQRTFVNAGYGSGSARWRSPPTPRAPPGQRRSFNQELSQRKGTDLPIADRPQNATNRNNMSLDMTPTGVRYSLNRTRRGLCRCPSARFHSPPIIRAACRRQRRWVLRALAYIPPRRSHPPTAASPAARRSANAAQAPACRARMNSGI